MIRLRKFAHNVIAEGEHKKAVKMALKLKKKGISLDEISELTDLSVEEVKSL